MSNGRYVLDIDTSTSIMQYTTALLVIAASIVLASGKILLQTASSLNCQLIKRSFFLALLQASLNARLAMANSCTKTSAIGTTSASMVRPKSCSARMDSFSILSRKPTTNAICPAWSTALDVNSFVRTPELPKNQTIFNQRFRIV